MDLAFVRLEYARKLADAGDPGDKNKAKDKAKELATLAMETFKKSNSAKDLKDSEEFLESLD